uniref:Uncharacterized protein n=1 Tax=Globodera pallida TaxID=36090 RepID=A0A183BQV9_GLOPA
MNSLTANDASFEIVTENGEVDTLTAERGKGHNIEEKKEKDGVDGGEEAKTKSDELEQNAAARQQVGAVALERPFDAHKAFEQTLLKLEEYQNEQRQNQKELCVQMGELKKLVGPSADIALSSIFRCPQWNLGNGTIFGSGTNLGNGTNFGSGTNFGNGTIFGSGTNLGNGTNFGSGTNLGNGTNFGKGTNLGNGTNFGKGTNLGNGTNFGKGTNLGNGTNFGSGTNLGNGTNFSSGTIFGSGTNLGKRQEF